MTEISLLDSIAIFLEDSNIMFETCCMLMYVLVPADFYLFQIFLFKLLPCKMGIDVPEKNPNTK